MGKNETNANFAGDTNKINTNQDFHYQLQNNYNVVIGSNFIMQLASVQLYVSHNDKNIYYQWSGNVTSSPNLIAGCLLTIDLDNFSFQFKK